MPRRGSTFCLWHDPAAAAERHAVSVRGGHARSNQARARKQLGEGALTATELHALLSIVLKSTLSGRLEPGVANACANLGRAILEVGKASDFEQRLADVERRSRTLRVVS